MKRNMRTRLISSVLGEQRREEKTRQEQLEEAERARQIQAERKSWWSLAGQAVGALWGPAGVLIGMGLGKAIGDLATVGGKQAEEYKVSTDTGAWGGTEESAMLSKINKKLSDVDKSELGKDILDIGKKAATLYGPGVMKAMKTGKWDEFSLTKWGGGKSGVDILKDKYKQMFGKEEVVSKAFDFSKSFESGELLPIPDEGGFLAKMKQSIEGDTIPSLETVKKGLDTQRFESLSPFEKASDKVFGTAQKFEKFEDEIASQLLKKEYGWGDFPDPRLLDASQRSDLLNKAIEKSEAIGAVPGSLTEIQDLKDSGLFDFKGAKSLGLEPTKTIDQQIHSLLETQLPLDKPSGVDFTTLGDPNYIPGDVPEVYQIPKIEPTTSELISFEDPFQTAAEISGTRPTDFNPLSSGFQPFSPQFDMESILGEYEAQNLFGKSTTGMPTTMTRGFEQMEWKRKMAGIGSKFGKTPLGFSYGK